MGRLVTQSMIFIRRQFWPSGVVMTCVCLCLSVYVTSQKSSNINHPPLVSGLLPLRFLCGFFKQSTPLGDIYPRPVLAFGYCHGLRLSVSVRLCVCVSRCLPEPIHAITCDSFKSGTQSFQVQNIFAKVSVAIRNTHDVCNTRMAET